jgi:selenide,water dikinase
LETSDDAGVYKLTDELALVLTVDYITPPVDDPFLFGQIAAANALSDVYAMGGRPIACLNLLGFPSKKLPPSTMLGIMEGALGKIKEAGATLAGGHTTEDDEPKFGLSVTGLVHPDRIWRNSTAQVGDRLILTKPIGSGVLFNANRKGWVSPGALRACLDKLVALNKAAAEVLSRYTVHACTDVTGFGLAGHGYEMAKGSGVTLAFDLARIPIFDEALAMYERGVTTGVNASNAELVKGKVRFEVELPPWRAQIVYDPQTSGGLLAALPAGQTEAALADLRAAGVADAAIVGAVRAMERELLVFG